MVLNRPRKAPWLYPPSRLAPGLRVSKQRAAVELAKVSQPQVHREGPHGLDGQQEPATHVELGSTLGRSHRGCPHTPDDWEVTKEQGP